MKSTVAAVVENVKVKEEPVTLFSLLEEMLPTGLVSYTKTDKLTVPLYLKKRNILGEGYKDFVVFVSNSAKNCYDLLNGMHIIAMTKENYKYDYPYRSLLILSTKPEELKWEHPGVNGSGMEVDGVSTVHIRTDYRLSKPLKEGFITLSDWMQLGGQPTENLHGLWPETKE